MLCNWSVQHGACSISENCQMVGEKDTVAFQPSVQAYGVWKFSWTRSKGLRFWFVSKTKPGRSTQGFGAQGYLLAWEADKMTLRKRSESSGEGQLLTSVTIPFGYIPLSAIAEVEIRRHRGGLFDIDVTYDREFNEYSFTMTSHDDGFSTCNYLGLRWFDDQQASINAVEMKTEKLLKVSSRGSCYRLLIYVPRRGVMYDWRFDDFKSAIRQAIGQGLGEADGILYQDEQSDWCRVQLEEHWQEYLLGPTSALAEWKFVVVQENVSGNTDEGVSETDSLASFNVVASTSEDTGAGSTSADCFLCNVLFERPNGDFARADQLSVRDEILAADGCRLTVERHGIHPAHRRTLVELHVVDGSPLVVTGDHRVCVSDSASGSGVELARRLTPGCRVICNSGEHELTQVTQKIECVQVAELIFAPDKPVAVLAFAGNATILTKGQVRRRTRRGGQNLRGDIDRETLTIADLSD